MSILRKLARPATKILNGGFRKIAMYFHTTICDITLRMVFEDEMAKWKPDFVHAHDGISLPVAAKVAERCNAKLLFDSHELETHRNPPLPWLRKQQVIRMERKYLPQTDATFTVGHKIANHLKKEYGIPKPVVLYNSPRKVAMPLPERLMTRDRTDVRDELSAHNASFLIVHTGNVTFNRGIEQAVIGLSKAAEDTQFREKYPRGIHLALVGNSVPATVKRVEALQAKYGNRIKISYLPPVAPNRIVEYIRTANAAMSCGVPLVLSYEFGMPNKLFEAVLAGLPILSSDLIEKKRFVLKHNLGVPYQADDTYDLATAFLKLALNLETYQRTPEEQAEMVDQFSWEAQEKKLLAVYDELENGAAT